MSNDVGGRGVKGDALKHAEDMDGNGAFLAEAQQSLLDFTRGHNVTAV